MAPPKLTDRAPPAVATNHAPPSSRLPSRLKVPILVVLNLGLQAAAWSAIADFIPSDLAAVSKKEDDIVLPFARLAYKVLTVWLGWHLNYDYIDVGALSVIANAPFTYLVTTYYDVSTITAAALVHIDLFAIMLPTYLLRAPSAVHNANAPLRNRFLLNSFQVQTSNSLLAIGVYVVVLWGALRTYLNSFLVTHFELRTLENAHTETPVQVIWKTFVAGIAARVFILNPSIAAQPASGAATPVKTFDAATADLPETVKHNLWFFSRRTRTLIQQTVILSIFVLANTIQRCLTLEGTDFAGAAGYAGLWIFATAICAGWWVWIGDTDSDS